MSGGVWMSGLKSNNKLGDDQGIRVKFYGHEWEPAASEVPLAPDDVHNNIRLYGQGHVRKRQELPESMAVWDERQFKKAGDIFSIGFFVVRGKLADVLSRFDFGEGGLIPFTVYQADLETPYPGEFLLLNFGCIKNSILPEQSEDATKFLVRKATGVQVWHINDFKPDGEVVLSGQALIGPDLWFEEAAHNKIFMSDALAEALTEIGMEDVFRLKRCRIAGGGP
ncbi:hypothetical protein [Sphingomonas sp.]|uniref:hypothetical protein n=1 Tax=Sphingomonas sp. TaxID=28214 RepID=UPI00286BC1D4|nr:hypothetical protein [Sphingomonas sp.]